jgi:hypothetical protein
MTPKEVRWHMLCIKLKSQIAVKRDHVESYFRPEMNVYVSYHEFGKTINWQSPKNFYGGEVSFIEKENQVDSDIVRAVCKSLISTCPDR